jgi:hypothetical protein
MDDDDLSDADVREVILRGHLVTALTDDPRGVRFVVRGLPHGSEDEVEVVCRFLPSGKMRIITVYRAEE